MRLFHLVIHKRTERCPYSEERSLLECIQTVRHVNGGNQQGLLAIASLIEEVHTSDQISDLSQSLRDRTSLVCLSAYEICCTIGSRGIPRW